MLKADAPSTRMRRVELYQRDSRKQRGVTIRRRFTVCASAVTAEAGESSNMTKTLAPFVILCALCKSLTGRQRQKVPCKATGGPGQVGPSKVLTTMSDRFQANHFIVSSLPCMLLRIILRD